MAVKVSDTTLFLPNDVALAGGDFKELAQAAKVSFSPRLQEKLRIRLNRYVEDIAIYRAAPRIPALGKRLKAAELAASRMVEVLSALMRITETIGASTAGPRMTRMELEDFCSTAGHFASCASIARAALTRDEGGPRGNPCLPDLIRDLHALYRRAGGKRKVAFSAAGEYSGPFLDFMICALSKAGERATKSLGKAIQTCLSMEKTLPSRRRLSP